MRWYNNLYISPSAKKKSKKIIWKIKHKAGLINVYVITLASNSSNLLDIIPSGDLLFLSYPRENVKVLGIAKGYTEALELSCKIVKEVYENTGKFDVHNYFKNSFKEVSR
ncbi:hypothetical protein [Lachnobacterium bovis]|uniref:Uncharacterized protein n=1 Tax=Lachnobacterium bovis TaxID=140626 RepID=A0A1H9QN19_9FIRM|nr:hypothetical protein [Lachnobacterium bovis]SER61981.1 hypothetical protein SAMN02910429_00623 [Lachnobacterium bovis]